MKTGTIAIENFLRPIGVHQFVFFLVNKRALDDLAPVLWNKSVIQ